MLTINRHNQRNETMTSLLRADLLKTGKRPMGWSMLGSSLALLTLFMVVVAYVVPADGPVPINFRYPQGLLVGPSILNQFGPLLMIVFGASLIGTEYRFDTWKNLLTRRAGRVPFIVSKWITLLIAVVLGIVVVSVWSQGLGALLGAESSTNTMSLNSVLAQIGVYGLSWLVAGTIGMLGAVLGRTTVAGIILGVVWLIGEGIAAPLVQLSERVAWIGDGLFTNASASLLSYASDAPARFSLLHSGIVAVAYLIIPMVIAAYVFGKRDMAG
jgi:ABC-type transport system involved in multi-copper enzyme maturation permease subunit